ncbi:kinase-like domain-containing protein [Tanacetum coccineum]
MKSSQEIIHLSSSARISFLFYGLAITCLTFATISASYVSNETDYHALLSFKSTITHDPYKVLATWNHSSHFCDWSGISCGKRHKRVTVLQLDSQGLEGSLSPHVGNLSFLRELYLRNNSFQATIPHELGRLSRLRRLYLDANKFNGVIPANLSGCSNLERLVLGENKLVGSIPKEISLLSKLASLVIDGNNLTGGIPPFLGNITSMEVFTSSGNPLGGSIPDTLGHWKSLTDFYSGDCNLYGSIPHSIFNLSLLVNFSVAVNHLTGSLPSEIGNQLPNLEWLQLYHNKLTGVLPPSISNCSKLGNLEMTNNNFSGKLAIDFSKLKDINNIVLSENNFHGRGKDVDMSFVESLKNCTRLISLELLNCNLIGVLPVSIGNLSDQLTFLNFGGNQLFGNLPSGIGSLVGLTTLFLDSNRFKGKIPTTIGKLQKLHVLGLSINQFSGHIPDAIGNLSLLIKLFLNSNKLEGHMPSSLRNCKNLLGLNVAENRLSGKIPKKIFQLPSLTYFLDLSENSLSGSIPSEIKDLKMLSYLDLSYNNLSGTITSSLGECISLTNLYLGGNIFQGMIPSSLSSLGGLGVLDISQNKLSGKIPQFLDKWKSLEFLNLSFNDFEGEVPVVGVFADASAFSVLGNNKLCGGLVTLELPKCKDKGSKKKRFPFFILAIVVAPTLLIVLCCLYLLCKKKRNSQPSQSSGNERFLKVSYNELLKATDGFSSTNLIGEGGFSSVYKGILDSDDEFVAVKVLQLKNRGARKSFLAECEAWRNIRHRNLLKIITSCSSTDFQGNDFKALVYEFMSNGSVHDWLHSSANTSKLNLLQRINILRDVATALDYLHNHCQTTILHGDLKPSNILLDADMVAHVGDFGLARLLGTDLYQNSSTGVKGTIGYAPPEYGIGSEMTSSGDVYSFGILLLEVMTGRKPTDDMFNEGLSLHKFAYVALPDHVIDVIDNDAIVLQSTEANAKKVEECLTATIKIGVSCSVDSPPQRTKIEIVVIELQRDAKSVTLVRIGGNQVIRGGNAIADNYVNDAITNSDGVVFADGSVVTAFVSHYEAFLGQPGNTTPFNNVNLFPNHLDVNDAAAMVRPVTNQEVKEAMFSMGNSVRSTKDEKIVLVPDGYTVAFFKEAWDIVANDVTKAIQEFFVNDTLLKELNHTIIALIPKIIANMIKDSLKFLISPNQSAFVSGRQISDNILLTQELMHNYHLDRGVPRCAFKVDIQKAYDTVDWDFLKDVLLAFGFHNQMGIRGLRQEMEIINLYFTDDLFLFAHGDANSASVIMEALDEFKHVSVLVPSLPKSTTYFCNVLNHMNISILHILPFEEGQFPVKYLGVPLVSSLRGLAGYNMSTKVVDAISNGIWKWPKEWLSKYPHLTSVTVPAIGNYSNDTLEWRNSVGVVQQFSVSTVWNCIRSRDQEVDWYNMVWFLNCIPHRAFQLWLVINRKLKTQDHLLAWDNQILFWNAIKAYAGCSSVSDSFASIMAYLVPICKRRQGRVVIAKLVEACAYYIWQERNWRLFRNQSRSPTQVIDSIKSECRNRDLFVQPPPPPPPQVNPISKELLKSLRIIIPCYDGGDPLGWIFQVEQFFDIHQTPVEHRIQLASFYLDGLALSWFQWLCRNAPVNDWDSFVKALNDRFGPPENEDFQVTFLLSCFISGFQPEIQTEVASFAPSTISRALALAKVQENKLSQLRSQPRLYSPYPPLLHTPSTQLSTLLKTTTSKLLFRRLTQSEMAAR